MSFAVVLDADHPLYLIRALTLGLGQSKPILSDLFSQ